MTAILQNANGPAEAATSPSQGSTNPAKDQEMNVKTNITTAKPAPDLMQKVSQLEDPINDAIRMASILATLVEKNLSLDTREVTGRRDHYIIGRDDVDDILFSVYQTQGYVRDINRAFEEVLA